jgi:hypothetical protein
MRKQIVCLFIISIFALVSSPHARADTWTSGYIYCGTKVEIPNRFGQPEQWEFETKHRIIREFLSDKNQNLNYKIKIVPPNETKSALREAKYIIPCAALFNDKLFAAYMASHGEKARQKNKMMECVYEHRKEINAENKAAIEYVCNQRAKKR